MARTGGDSPAATPLAPDLAERLARIAPEVHEVITNMHGEVWAALDPELLELCRLRIATLQSDDEEFARPSPGAPVAAEKSVAIGSWSTSPLFSDRERACLAFTEQFVGDVAGTTQEDVDGLLSHLSPQEVQAFVTALLALDQHQRLALGLRTVLAPEEETG